MGGSHDGALVVRVREPAVDGRANRAVVAALAEALGVGRGAVRIVAGAAARHKLVEVDGDGPGSFPARRWETLLAEG